uniref:Uncharacterized protein n=1 Tax=Anguilla anguilla TaxID=7936 RepID=A0A0E9QTJ1_ANGAN
MFVIQWVYACINIVVAIILFLYIGQASPGLPIGEYRLLNVAISSREIPISLIC